MSLTAELVANSPAVVKAKRAPASKAKMKNGVKKIGSTYSFVVYTEASDGNKKPIWSSKDSAGNPLKSHKAAVEARAEALATIAGNTYVAPTSVTVEEWLNRWLETKAQSVKPKSYDSYRQHVLYYLIPTFGKIPLRSLRGSQITIGYNNLFASGGSEGKGLSVSTVAGSHRVFRLALNAAVKDRVLARNPCLDASVPKDTQAKKKVKVISPEQVRELLKLAEGHRLYALFFLAIHTGMRRGECVALRWEDVDLAKNTVTVSRNAAVVKNRDSDGTRGTKLTRIEGTPKGNKSRVIPISPAVVAVLKAHKKRQLEERLHAGSLWENAPEVFTSPTGAAIYPDTPSGIFTKLRKSLTLTDAQKLDPPSFHSLRHTYATLLLRAGIPVHIVADRLGHASPQITWDTYCHLLEDDTDDTAQALEKALSI